MALDADSFLVGTDNGVARSDDSGASFVLLQVSSVVFFFKHHTRSGAAISWLLADHSGLARRLRRPASRGGLESKPAPGIATAAKRLVHVLELGLVTTGGQLALVSSARRRELGPLADQPPLPPDGIVRAGSGAAPRLDVDLRLKPGSPGRGRGPAACRP